MAQSQSGRNDNPRPAQSPAVEPTTVCRASQGGRAVLERAGRCQPPDGRAIDVIGPRHIGHRLAGVKALQCFLALMGRHLAWATEPDTALLGALAALARPGAD